MSDDEAKQRDSLIEVIEMMLPHIRYITELGLIEPDILDRAKEELARVKT